MSTGSSEAGGLRATPAPAVGADRQAGCAATWKILVATDGSECAAQSQEFLRRFAWPEGTAIRVVGVAADPFMAAGAYGDTGFVNWDVNQELLDAEVAMLSAATAEAERRLAREGWHITRTVRAGAVSHEILLAAEEFGADFILAGTRGLTGLDRLLLGSTARTVARHASRPVLVARAPKGAVSRVVLAVDGSEHSSRAAALLARLPLAATTAVRVVHVVQPYRPLAERLEVLPGGRARIEPKIEAARRRQQEAAAGLARAVCRRLETAGKKADPVTLVGHPADEILKLAESEHADLLVTGARGTSLIPGLLIGSVADSLLQSAPCSILLAR